MSSFSRALNKGITTVALTAALFSSNPSLASQPNQIPEKDPIGGQYWPKQDEVRIQGRVIDPLTNNGVPYAKVRMKYLTTGAVDSTLSDCYGEFWNDFRSAYSNSHRFVIEAEKDGYYSYRDTLQRRYDVVSVDQNDSRFMVGQNYPNPFRATTKIPIELEKPQRVDVQIFSVDGRLVSSFSQAMNRGYNVFEWDESANGHTAPGIYFAQIRAGENARTIKMVLAQNGNSTMQKSTALLPRPAEAIRPNVFSDTAYIFQKYIDPDNASSADARKDLLEFIKFMHYTEDARFPGITWIHRWKTPIDFYLNTAEAPAPSQTALQITRNAIAKMESQTGMNLFNEVPQNPGTGIKIKYGPGPCNGSIILWAVDGKKIPLYPLLGSIGLTTDQRGNPLFDEGSVLHEWSHILYTPGEESPFCTHVSSNCSSRKDLSDFETRALTILYNLPNTSEKRFLIYDSP